MSGLAGFEELGKASETAEIAIDGRKFDDVLDELHDLIDLDDPHDRIWDVYLKLKELRT